MSSLTLLYIVIAGIAALSLALFQYIYRSKLKSKLKYSLFVLRTLSIFGILLLLINPKFESVTYFNQKPTLVIALDDSESIAYLKQDSIAKQVFDRIKNNEELNQKFNINTYTFGKTLEASDSFSFKSKQSNISKALTELDDIYDSQMAPIVLLSDGNQTYGTDYSYVANKLEQPIYSIAMGDSTVFSDLSIRQLNVNRYVFLKNKFPVEAIVNYNGTETLNTELRILSGNKVVFKQPLVFSATKTSEIVSTSLLANSVGVKTYKVEILPIPNEKNKVNNIKYFGVEVIDQKTNIALVSEQLHPDLGALKKAIESNEQRSVTILNPSDYKNDYDNYQLAILYQPTSRFNDLFKLFEDQKLNSFIITGTTTNWRMLNEVQDNFKHTITNQTENYQPNLNRNYGTFIIDQLSFNNFPPLKSEFGDFGISVPNDILLYKTVNGITTDQPLLATFETNGTKNAILTGEDIWRWRAQSYLDTNSFTEFDNFMGKLIQYLSSNKQRRRLNIDYKSFYNGNDDVIITAQYFNKSFEFDPKASLNIILKNKDTNELREVPLLLNNGNYTVDLSGIESGTYDFTIKHSIENVSASGSFQILEYNIEQQFLNADIEKLKTIATSTNGNAYLVSDYDRLFSDLFNDNRYATIQKSTKNIVPLIDWKYLLVFIAISLFLEWFIRKYNGLI